MSRHSQQSLTQGASQDVTIKPSINTLAQGSMFWQPDYRRASPWLEHTPFLFWLVEAVQPRLSVGLGVDAVSHLAICQAVKRLRLDTHNYLVTGSEESAASDEAARELAAEEYATSSHWMATTPTRAIQQFDEGSIDLLVLNVAADDDSVDYLIDRWLSRLSSQGVVLLPGIARREPGCQVFRIFETLKAQYPHFTFHHGDGLGVLAVGQKHPALLENLFNAVESPASSQVVQDIFARLGRSCRDKLTAQEQRTLVQQLEARVAKHQAQWQELEAQQATLNEQLEKANRDRKELKGRIASQEERFANERGRLAERVSSLEEFNVELKNELMRQRSQGEQREVDRREQATALKDTQAALEEQKQSQQQLSHSLKVSKDQAEQYRTQVEEKEAALKALQEELDAVQKAQQEQAHALEATRQESAIRFEELAKLTTLLEEKDVALDRAYAAKAEELDQAHTELERVRAEWEKSQSGIQQYQQESATRFEELAKLTALLEEKDVALERARVAKAEELDQAHTKFESLRLEWQKSQSDIQRYQQESQTRFEELAKLTNLLESSEQVIERERKETAKKVERLERELAQQRQEAKAFADDRFRELAILTELLEKKEAEYQQEIDRQARELALISREEVEPFSVSSEEIVQDAASELANPTVIKKELPLSKRTIKRQAALIESSAYFDAQWYLAQYPDIAADPGMSAHPARHYLLMGGFEGRNPGPEFDSAYYLSTHDDVAQSGINPLIHYIKFGEKEQRSIQG